VSFTPADPSIRREASVLLSLRRVSAITIGYTGSDPVWVLLSLRGSIILSSSLIMSRLTRDRTLQVETRMGNEVDFGAMAMTMTHTHTSLADTTIRCSAST
jgi:hypothetical protein